MPLRAPSWHPAGARSRLSVGLLVALGMVALITLLGLIDLWPDGGELAGTPGAPLGGTASARVVGVEEGGCRSAAAGVPEAFGIAGCRRVEVELTSGPDRGGAAEFDLGGGFAIAEGDRVRVTDTMVPPGATVNGQPADRYSFSDFERRGPLLWLTLLFAALVLLTARWRGLRALIGLAASLALVAFFIVPAILEGRSPVAVATIGALAIMLVTIPVAHGLDPKAVAACLGTAAALIITLLLAEIATDFAHITGFASEDVTFLRASAGDLSVRGLLLAGIVIAALGVLDDLTVSQASTVMALRRANPALGASDLFRRGMSVGHDHIVATVNTLVLAYAGASLPALLVFSLADTPVGDAVNSEIVAADIVATLVGSIGLIAAVPITTALSALLAVRVDATELTEQAHAH